MQDVFHPEQIIKTTEDEEIKSHDLSTDIAPDKEVEIEVCDQMIQTSEANLKSFREMVEVQQTE